MAAVATTDRMREALAKFRGAAAAEGIEPGSSLGAWQAAQEMALLAMAIVVDEQREAIDERAASMQKAMAAQVELVNAEISKVRVEAQRLELETAGSIAKRGQDVEALAAELSSRIAAGITRSTLLREKRFNRRQNWSAVAASALVMLACFVGGAGWSAYRVDSSAVDRCARAAVKVGERSWCDLAVVTGD